MGYGGDFVIIDPFGLDPAVHCVTRIVSHRSGLAFRRQSVMGVMLAFLNDQHRGCGTPFAAILLLLPGRAGPLEEDGLPSGLDDRPTWCAGSTDRGEQPVWVER